MSRQGRSNKNDQGAHPMNIQNSLVSGQIKRAFSDLTGPQNFNIRVLTCKVQRLSFIYLLIG